MEHRTVRSEPLQPIEPNADLVPTIDCLNRKYYFILWLGATQ
jgi:hypothetical protein